MLGVIAPASLLVERGVVKKIWPAAKPPPAAWGAAVEKVDAEGRVVMPGLIDAHTHLVHGGDRAAEFAQRARGVSYEAIARQGGGIWSTVEATREASEEELWVLAAARAGEALAHGTTTMEVKSGYGLDLATELKILRVVQHLEERWRTTQDRR